RMRRPSGEDRERVEHLVRGQERLFEPELEGTQGRLAEHQHPRARRDRKGRPRRQRFDHIPLVRFFFAEVPRNIRLKVIAEPPDDGAVGTASLRRQTRDLLRGTLLVESRRERVAAETQKLARRERRSAFAVSTEIREDEGNVPSRQSRDRFLL